ncbi:coadhesin-like isoform X2 [Corticium candelabrum]|uniref:coadhesin-like isoform X2 n=1 Tax=Corticium candelabrum TaxID=121492 RepID=UPI002E25A5C4|nr:coadhesin-like isoform X2 [Corticium candelabrum]
MMFLHRLLLFCLLSAVSIAIPQRFRRSDHETPAGDDQPVDGGWSEWNLWSKCSKSCGRGGKYRSRSCTNPSPSHGGKVCEGSGLGFVSCNEHSCEAPLVVIHGGFGSWSNWSSCSETCGGGQTLRTRLCSNPTPSTGGRPCEGNFLDVGVCNSISCSVDGGWTEWTDFSQCTKSCGFGSQIRSRTCTNPEPKHDGKPCFGPREEAIECIIVDCPGNKCESLLSPNNGNVTTQKIHTTVIATYSCESGYLLKNGDSTRICLPSGLWSGTHPSCEGYELSDDKQKTRRCQENRKWSGTELTCTQIQCPDISNETIKDGSILSSHRLVDSIAVYECIRGYRIVGDKTRVCQLNGTWSGNPPICQGSKCDSLASPTNGNVTIRTVHTIVISTYSCESGYRIKNGDSSRVCLPNGLWSGKEPSCEPCSCYSTQTRQDANKKRHAVVLVQITSSAQEKNGQVSYKAKVKKVCRANKAIAHKIKSGNVASLAVTQQTQHGTCRCPYFQEKVMYKVGVKVNGKSGEKWQLEVPQNFYVAESTIC